MIDNEFIKKAEDELEYINSNEEEKMRAKFRERCEWNYNFDMESMYSAGIEEGIQKGIEKGIKEGIKEQSIAIAKKMLAKKIDIETIIETTGLTKDEIEKLKV